MVGDAAVVGAEAEGHGGVQPPWKPPPVPPVGEVLGQDVVQVVADADEVEVLVQEFFDTVGPELDVHPGCRSSWPP